MIPSRWYPVLFIAGIAALVGGAVLIERLAIARLLYDDAILTGRVWSESIARTITDLDAIAAGAPPSAADRTYFEQVRPSLPLQDLRSERHAALHLRRSARGRDRRGRPCRPQRR